jgi:hypothetical protein
MVKTTMNFARLAVAAIVAILIAQPCGSRLGTLPRTWLPFPSHIGFLKIKADEPFGNKTLLEEHPWYPDR